MRKAALLIPLLALAAGIALIVRRQASPDPASARAPAVAPGIAIESMTHGPEGTGRPSAARARGAGTLRIIVTSGGQPVEGASVTVREENGPGKKDFHTGTGGLATLLQVPEGGYHVTARLPLHVPNTSEAIVAADQVTDARIDLKPGGRVQGIVQDEGGRPVGGAALSLINPAAALAVIYPEISATSDEQGRYLLDGVPLEEMGLLCHHLKFKPWRKQGLRLRDVTDVIEVNVILEAGTILSGRVVDDQGAPVKGALVMGTNEQNYEGVCDAEGRFVLYGLGNGAVSMCVRAPGFGTVYPRRIPAGTQGLEFRLPRAGEVSGRIDAAPLPELFAIMLCRYEQELGRELRLQARTFEGPDGALVLRDIAPGTYRVEVDAPGYESIDKPYVVVSAGSTTSNITLRLKKSN